MRPRWYLPAELLIIALGVALALVTAVKTSPTWDEGKHVVNGISFATRGYGMHEETPSAVLYTWLIDPGRFVMDFDQIQPRGTLAPNAIYRLHAGEADTLKVRSRLASVVSFGLLLWLVAAFARRLFPNAPAVALTTLALCAFDPTLIAHSAVATADTFLATAMLGLGYAVWRFCERPRLSGAVLIAIGCGATMAAKLPGVFVTTFTVLLLVAWAVVDGAGHRREGRSAAWRTGAIAIVAVGAVLVLDASYGFRGVGRSIANLGAESPTFTKISKTAIGRLKLPLPQDFVRAMDYSMADEIRRDVIGEGDYYLFGEKYGKHKWIYFPLTFLFKVSFVHLALLALGVVALARSGAASRWTRVVLVGYAAMFFGVNVFLNPFDIGVRYLLPVFPFSALIAGFALARGARWARIAPLIVVPFYAANAIYVCPDGIGAFNASSWFVSRYYLLSDSNIDWGQSNVAVVEDLEKHPAPRVCLDLGTPFVDALPSGVEVPVGLVGCRYYRSQTEPSKLPSFVDLGKPVRTLAHGLIEVYDVDQAHLDARYEPVPLEVTDLVPARGRKSIGPDDPEFVYHDAGASVVHSTDRPSHVRENVFPPHMCLGLRSATLPAGDYVFLRGMLLESYERRFGFVRVSKFDGKTPFQVGMCTGDTPVHGWIQLLRRKQ